MIYLILGRIGSHAEKLAKHLEEKNLSVSNFDEYDIDTTDAILLSNTDNLEKITESYPETAFKLVYVQTDDLARRFNYIENEKDKIKAEVIFSEIDKNQDAGFCELEDYLTNMTDSEYDLPENISSIYRYTVENREDTAENYADFLIYDKAFHDKLRGLIEESINLGIIKSHPDDESKIAITRNDEIGYVTTDMFPDILRKNNDALAEFFEKYILLSPRFDDI